MGSYGPSGAHWSHYGGCHVGPIEPHHRGPIWDPCRSMGHMDPFGHIWALFGPWAHLGPKGPMGPKGHMGPYGLYIYVSHEGNTGWMQM